MKVQKGLIIASFTEILSVFVYYVVYITVYSKIAEENTWLFAFLVYSGIGLLLCWCHIVCVFRNPGVFSKELSEKYMNALCGRCLRIRIKHSHHCSKCKVCVFKMDHHCPWIHNCVGYGNQKEYIQFLIYTAFYCLYSGSFILWSKFYCATKNTKFCRDQGIYLIDFSKLLSLGIISFFFVFIIYLLYEQYESIKTGKSQVDRLKEYENFEKNEFWKNLNEVFGNQGGIFWILPISCREDLEKVIKIG